MIKIDKSDKIIRNSKKIYSCLCEKDEHLSITEISSKLAMKRSEIRDAIELLLGLELIEIKRKKYCVRDSSEAHIHRKTDSNRIPKVLFLGNGINLLGSNTSWDNLLYALSNGIYQKEKIKQLKAPMPLKATLLTKNHVEERLKEKKNTLYGEILSDAQMNSIERLLNMGFDHILTTNFSYEIEAAALEKRKISNYYLQKMSTHVIGPVDKVEPNLMVYSLNQINYGGYIQNIWHVHGEARKISSVILDHDKYSRLLSKIKTTIDKNRYYIQDEKKANIKKEKKEKSIAGLMPLSKVMYMCLDMDTI